MLYKGDLALDLHSQRDAVNFNFEFRKIKKLSFLE